MILVTGGSGSGKSQYAEHILAGQGLPFRWYAATMKVYGREEEQKVERHRRQRQGRGFVTAECPVDLERFVPGTPRQETGILLECVTNLTANEMFRQDGSAGQGKRNLEEIGKHILKGVAHLKESCACLVAVTGQVGEDGASYSEETRDYIRLLGWVNQELARQADQVIEVVAGIPLIWKGGEG